MKATAVSLIALFEAKLQLEVPLFQRQYVWQKERHWEPLWEDISRKFADYLDGRKSAPVHFLGALVLDQKQTPATHVAKRQVIDGQQRLTTFQIFLSALRDFAGEQGCSEIATECGNFTSNKGMMADPEVDRFKVWPTQLDRPQFADVVGSGSRLELLKRYPEKRRPKARKAEPRPRMVEAYLYFYQQLNEFFLGVPGELPLAAEVPLPLRLEECFQALKNSLQVVEIDLEQGDDAQVIFETLNARGEPLLPADLLRNYIFLRAARAGEPQEALYKTYWSRFDEEFWRVSVKQGRLLRPRSDLFLQHFLSSRLGTEVPVMHLFEEYKFWVESDSPFASVEEELKCLSRQGDEFRRLIAPQRDDVLYGLATFLDAFEVSTAYPLLLALLERGLNDEDWMHASRMLESYILRRAVCGLTAKNYNRIFLSLVKTVRREEMTVSAISRQLMEQGGESSEWPTDERFSEAWRTQHSYHVLNNPKIVHIFSRLNETFVSTKSEAITVDRGLSVEHIMPQKWQQNWPLPDGSKGLSELDMLLIDDLLATRVDATRHRDRAVQTIGNLTILTQSLNSSVSNSAWSEKRPELLRNSLLPINLRLADAQEWDEAAIAERSEELLARALVLWPRDSVS